MVLGCPPLSKLTGVSRADLNLTKNLSVPRSASPFSVAADLGKSACPERVVFGSQLTNLDSDIVCRAIGLLSFETVRIMRFVPFSFSKISRSILPLSSRSQDLKLCGET